ncbi:MAG: PLP-dependent transferase, partial [Chitinophagaceae bacterium]
WLLIRGLRTLPARLERITNTTREVLTFLKQHPRIDTILFPLDESFPQYSLAKEQMRGASGLLTITLKAGTAESITRFCEALKHFSMAVSWGGYESLVIPKCAGFSPAQFDPGNTEHQYIRIYTGLEDPQYLINDLAQALES